MKKVSSPGELTKQGLGCTDGGQIWSHGTWVPRALECRHHHAMIRGIVLGIHSQVGWQITAQSLQWFIFSVLHLFWRNSYSSELSSDVTSSGKSLFLQCRVNCFPLRDPRLCTLFGSVSKRECSVGRKLRFCGFESRLYQSLAVWP